MYKHFIFNLRLSHLKRQCEPHLVECVRGSVETLCTKIYHLSADHVRKIRERHGVLLKGSGVPEVSAPLVPPIVRKVWCYPVQFALPPIRMPNVEYLNERENMTVKYTHPSMQQPDTHIISSLHLQKLVSLIKN